MRKSSWMMLVCYVLAVSMLAGCGSRKSESTQVKAPAAAPPVAAPAQASTGAASLPGDQAALKAALGAVSGVKYEIITVDTAGGKDKNDYLDAALAPKGWPEKSMLVLMIFTGENHDIRFAMGADFNQKKVSVDEMLVLVRNQYLTKAKDGNAAGGLADLIQAVNQRMAQ